MPDQDVQVVEVPGVGEVEFPASMSDADVLAAVQRLSAPAAPSRRDRALKTMQTYGLKGNEETAVNMLGGGQATVGIPGLARAAGPALRTASERPLGQAAIGAAVGGIEGGPKGALKGGLLGLAGGGLIGQLFKRFGAASGGASRLAPKSIPGSSLFQPGEMVPAMKEIEIAARAAGLPANQVAALGQQVHRDFLLRNLDRVPISPDAAGAILGGYVGGRGGREK